ncbi:hypothetical protein C1894_27260 [Pseudomonas sp. FW305-3-2-15-E-TSA2]|nr:hypothetical protein C1895_22540 [Pseudomonas sp. FW305-3-2-15-E-TSA4]POA33257.1 hypothetical protein C1894_27260 [Pseudomonas sp. FW305-3-2-15-E-TSA2]
MQAIRKPVGASLLAKAMCQLTFALLTHRYREQAHSYREQRRIRGFGVCRLRLLPHRIEPLPATPGS